MRHVPLGASRMGSGALPCVRDIATLNEDARTRERRSLGAPDIGLSALRTCAEDRLRHEGPADPPRDDAQDSGPARSGRTKGRLACVADCDANAICRRATRKLLHCYRRLASRSAAATIPATKSSASASPPDLKRPSRCPLAMGQSRRSSFLFRRSSARCEA